MKRIPFLLLLLLCVAMGAATFVEKSQGSRVAAEWFYHSAWFVALWALILLSGLWLLLRHRGRDVRPAALLLHGAFALILAGALLTHLTSLSGLLHLRRGVPETSFRIDSRGADGTVLRGRLQRLPFRIVLQDFRIICYPGTQAPADYASTVAISPSTLGEKRSTFAEKLQGSLPKAPQVISMNRILRVRGYRLYQSSYDPDGQGSWLMVSYDPYGIPATYAGYALLALAMCLTLLDPRGGFRRLLRHPLLRRGAIVGSLLLLPAGIGHARDEQRPDRAWLMTQTLPAPQAEEMGRLQVLYNDRIAPLHTLAHDFTLKLTGTSHYLNLRPEQFLCAWLFYPQMWQYEPLFRIENSELRHRLGTGKRAKFTDFFTAARAYKLQFLWNAHEPGKSLTPLEKAALATDEQVQLIAMLQGGTLLKMFPLRQDDGSIGWYSPTDSLPKGTPRDEARFVRGFFSLVYEAIQEARYDEVSRLIGKLAAYQQQRGGHTLLSSPALRAEIAYNRFEPTAWLYRLCLVLGLAGFLVYLFAPGKSRLAHATRRIVNGALPIVFLILTATVALRSYISGRLPLGNGYETMLFLSWCILAATFFLRRRLPLATVFGLLLAGFALLVSTLSSMNPQITPLMPVLLSPWLSLHVSVLMMAYALCAFTCIGGLSALLLLHQGRKEEVERLTVVSRLLLYPSTFLLGIGIFVGAVWANASWGSYWSWDPKEVWALISFLLYALPLHERSLPFFRSAKHYHAYTAAAFLALLMTYFGVNYFLGGMHSYAG